MFRCSCFLHLFEKGIDLVTCMQQRGQEMLEFDAITEVAVDDMEDRRL